MSVACTECENSNQICSQTYEFHCSSLIVLLYSLFPILISCCNNKPHNFPRTLPSLRSQIPPRQFPICRIISTLLPFSKLKRFFLVAKP